MFWSRIYAVLAKELIQMRRDRLTFAMMIGIPIMQLVLFGYAINNDPKDLPTAALVQDHGPYSRTLLAALENTGYFDIDTVVRTEAEAQRQLQSGAVNFVITIPQDFERELMRGDRPQLLVQADATDPAATSNALAAVQRLSELGLREELRGVLASLEPDPPVFDLVIHRLYNPEGITAYNIVPGLIGVVLTMSTILMTSLALTRETERGTMENLLAMPLRPIEVMLGKILPYIAIGCVQVVIILAAAPCTAMVFVWSNLSDGHPGFTLSQVALNDTIMVFAFAPIVALLLGISSIHVPWETLFLSVVLYIVLPVIDARDWRR